MFDFPFASARDIALTSLLAFEPEERLSVAAYAAAHRKVENLSVSPDGNWYNEKVPYTVRPSECLDSLDHLTVAVVGPGQVAKTVIAENWMLKSVGQDPADMLWYMQTDDGVESYVKGRINTMIDLHEDILKAKLGKRAVDDSLHFKRFAAMWIEFLSASPKTLINKSAPRIVADEVDNWNILGDPKSLLDIRRQTFGRRSMLLAMSHPDQARGMNAAQDWTGGIMAIYGDSDRQVWYWPCPHCGGWSSPVPTADRYMSLIYPTEQDVPLDVVAAETYLLCPCCNKKITDDWRESMNLAAYRSAHGGWIGLGQEIDEGGTVYGELVPHDTAGFWIVGAMSPFVLGGIGGLAKARVKAEREADAGGEDASLRQVMVKQWGVPYTPRKNRAPIEVRVLVERADPLLRKGRVPDWVRFLTVAVDCQKGFFEYLTRGWGVKGESVIIDHGRILANPDTSAEDWDKLRAQVVDPGYLLDDDSGRRMKVRAFGFDLHGEEGVTHQAYSAFRRWRGKPNGPRMYGLIGGREAWSILPLRGNNKVEAQKLVITYPDTGKVANKAAGRGEVPVGQFNPNKYKDDLLGQLKKGEAGADYIHLPAWAKAKEGDDHPWFNQLVAERANPSGRWEKVQSHAHNEVLDLMVMNHVLAHLHGIYRLNWDRPPNWAQPQATNINVYTPGDDGPKPSSKPAHRKLA